MADDITRMHTYLIISFANFIKLLMSKTVKDYFAILRFLQKFQAQLVLFYNEMWFIFAYSTKM